MGKHRAILNSSSVLFLGSPSLLNKATFSICIFCFDVLVLYTLSKRIVRDFPGGPVVKNPPSNAGDMGSIPGWGTKIPHAPGQLSPHTTTTEPMCRKLQSPCTTDRKSVV